MNTRSTHLPALDGLRAVAPPTPTARLTTRSTEEESVEQKSGVLFDAFV
jgi:hypothetical protein